MRSSSEEQSIHFFVNFMRSGWSRINSQAPWCPFRVSKSYARDLALRRAGSRVRFLFLPLATGITVGSCVPHDSSDCGVVRGPSCCVQDAHCKHVHSATRLIVYLRGQQQRHTCVHQGHQRTGRTWRSRTNKRTCKQEELGEPWCPQGDCCVLWTSGDGLLY